MRLRRMTGLTCALALCLTFPLSFRAARAAGTGTNVPDVPPAAQAVQAKAALAPVEVSFAEGGAALSAMEGAHLDGESVYIEEEGVIALTLEAAPGVYMLTFEYDPLPESTQNIQLALSFDGEAPSRAAENILLRRRWRDREDAQREDSRGNDLRLPQEEIPFAERGWLEAAAKDSTGYETGPLLFTLKETQTLQIRVVQSTLRIRRLRFEEPETAPDYAEYAAAQAGKADAVKSAPLMEAEQTAWKNDPSLFAVSDRSTPATSPSKGAKISLNIIGGEKWAAADSTLAWQVQVEQSGLYEIRLRCRQNYSQGFYATRSLRIDGELPFAQADNLRFVYQRGWQMIALGDDTGEPYKFYFEAGKTYTLSLTVSLGDFAALLGRTSESIAALNDIYRQLLMIMSASPDGYRDYNLDELIPETIAEMQRQAVLLDGIADEVGAVSGREGSDLESLRKLAIQLRSFVEDTGRVAANFSFFKDNIAALNDWASDAASRPLDLDTIQLAAPGSPRSAADVGFFSRLWYGTTVFFASFFEDYTSLDALTGEADELITVWSVSGRDQASVYNDMIRSFYQPQSAQTYGKTVGVRLQIVAADTILPSLATGRGPDVLMGVGVGQPVDFAMRGVLTDLRTIAPKEELDEVLARFRQSAYDPFTYENGLYALPEQQSFLTMFLRTDILEDLGITLPTVEKPWTWEDIKSVLPTLQKNNMSILMETGANANTNGLGSFAMLLYQRGGAFYTDDRAATALDTEAAVETFRYWTDLYNRGGLPGIFNLANRFRTGESPIAIADYTLYNTLAVSAPEIQGMWEMALVPGTVREDGTVDHSSYSSSTGVVLLSSSVHLKAAWDYMKWWTGAEAQTTFGKEMESLLGVSARYPTANLEAMKNLNWTAQNYRVLSAQADWAKAVPEVPGGYYLPRYINNAFRTATRETGRLDAREAILICAQIVNDEIKQKREEFQLDS